jgi:hypothetical protein
MQSSDEIRITWPGRVIVEKGKIVVDGFTADNASCREVATMAAAWAIGELQREMLKNIERPGGGNIGVDGPLDLDLKDSTAEVELLIEHEGELLLQHEGSLRAVLLYAAGQLESGERLELISQLQASHQEMDSRFR